MMCITPTPNRLFARQRLVLLALAFLSGALLLWTLAGLVRGRARAGIDLHPYWYAGHFTREGRNPYRGYFPDQTPTLPVNYLDGAVTRALPVARPNLSTVPAYTAPLVLLFTPLAYLSWPVAHAAWLLVNLSLLGASLWLIFRLLPPDPGWHRTARLAVSVLMIGALPVRTTLARGQSSFLVLVLMLGAYLLAERRPWVAGLLLGVALSKYTLALPVVVLFLWQKRWRLLAVAGLVQLIAPAVITLFSGDSYLGLWRFYALMVTVHSPQEGVHLAYLLAPWLDGQAATIVGAGAGLLALAALYTLWHRRPRPNDVGQARLLDAFWLAILGLWSLLAVYHRLHDATLIALFLIPAVYALLTLRGRMMPAARRRAAWFALAAILLPIYLPDDVYRLGFAFTPVAAESVVLRATSLALVAALTLAVWWLRRWTPAPAPAGRLQSEEVAA